jgi:hypothetical protein
VDGGGGHGGAELGGGGAEFGGELGIAALEAHDLVVAAGAAPGDGAGDAGALADGAGEEGVDADMDAGLLEHLEDDELVEFGVDGCADGVVVVALGHFGVAGGGADFGEAVDDFLRDAADDVAFGDAGEGFPEVVEGMEGGAGALARSGDGGDYTASAPPATTTS